MVKVEAVDAKFSPEKIKAALAEKLAKAKDGENREHLSELIRALVPYGISSMEDVAAALAENLAEEKAQKPEGAQDPIELTHPISPHGGVRISVSVETTAKTGVEMEALTGVMGAALTVVDMCKGVDRGCVIEGVRVVGKRGGRSEGWGVWAGEGNGEGEGEGEGGGEGREGDGEWKEKEGGRI